MDAEEFDAFHAASFQRLIGQIYAMIGNRDEAQDCVPEAFVRADVEGGEGMRRNVHLYTPEVCTECDAIWFDRQGAALVGHRLVLGCRWRGRAGS